MKLKYLLLALLLPTLLHAQGVRYDSNIFTAASNVPVGAQAPMYTLPYSVVFVCASPATPATGSACTNLAPIFTDQALSQPITQPITSDSQGRYGFWIAPGTYTYSVVSPSGAFLGTSPITFGGSSSSTAGSYVQPDINSFVSNLEQCSSQICNVVILGDSFAICTVALCAVGPTTATNRWPEQLRIALQNNYGSHGTGIIPTNLGYSSVAAATLNSMAWSCTGSVDFNTSTLGPSQSAAQQQNSLLHLSNGATCTFHDSRGIQWGGVPGGLVTYCMTTSTSGSLSASIDGFPIGNLCGTPTGSPTANAVQTTYVLPGAHTVTYTSNGDSYIYGAEGTKGSSGVSVHLVAVSGSMAEMFNSASKLAFTDLIPSGTQIAILAEYTNDVNLGESVSNYASYMTTIVNHERALSGSPPLLLEIPPVTNAYSSGAQVPYTSAALGLCSTLPISCVNIQDRWGAVYSNLNSLWNVSHPNDKGAIGVYSQIFKALSNPVPNTGGSGSTVTGVSTSSSTAAVTANNLASDRVIFSGNTLCPNMTTGEYCVASLGVDTTTTYDGIGEDFLYVGAGSTSNEVVFNFNNSLNPPLAMFANGHVSVGSTVDPTVPFGVSNEFFIANAGNFKSQSATALVPSGNLINNAAAHSVYATTQLCPNLSSGQFCISTVGVDQATSYDAIGLDFEYVGAGSTSNEAFLNFTNSTTVPITMFGTGDVAIGYASTQADPGVPLAVNGAMIGPVSAPSGACTTNGAWAFSQDGHATFCASGTWTTKI